MIDEQRTEIGASYDWQLIGAYRHAFVNDSEAIVVWAVPTW